MKVIALTGGVACGKTTVADRLAEKGFPVIDTDEIARDLLSRDPAIQRQVFSVFSTTDRKKLREMIFSDIQKRKRLEQILHPPILAEVEKRLKELRKRRPEPKAAIVIVPLLYEAKVQDRFDEVIAVVSEEKNQIARLVARDGIAKDLAQQMIAAQISNEEKVRLSKHVIRNDGDLHLLLRAVDGLIPKLTA